MIILHGESNPERNDILEEMEMIKAASSLNLPNDVINSRYAPFCRIFESSISTRRSLEEPVDEGLLKKQNDTGSDFYISSNGKTAI